MSKLEFDIDALMRDMSGRRERRRLSHSEVEDLIEQFRGELHVTDEHRALMRSIFCDLDNVLVTGGAGTGKTTFVGQVVIPSMAHLGLNIAVTATTGLAGSHLGGKTIHSWTGIKRGPMFPPTIAPQDMDPDEIADVYEQELQRWLQEPNKQHIRAGVKKRITNAEIVVLDEVSMCGGVALLGYLDFMWRRLRQSPDSPFGGIQMVFVGDFAQLPPVEKVVSQYHADWAFLSPSWQQANVRTHELTHVYRQDDRAFAGFLNQVRLGLPVDREYAKQFVRPMTREEQLKASWLVPTNAMAERINTAALENYPPPTYSLPAEYDVYDHHLDRYDTRQKIIDTIDRNHSTMRPKLMLRIGLPVMLTYNDPDGRFFNGSKGYVREVLCDEKGYVTEVQVDLANAQSDTPVTVNVTRMCYSRSATEDPWLTEIPYRTSEGVFINVDDRRRTVELDPSYGPLADKKQPLPLYPRCRQFPLSPANAITIHKSQGMSLDECVVDLRRTFAPGHVYVGMSRLRTAAGLTITTDAFKVQVDPDVMRFYLRLQSQKTTA